MPPYEFRFLDAAQRADVGKRATTPPAAVTPGETIQRAWEADLAAHQALLAAAQDDEGKKRHVAAVRALETALTKAAALSR